jgi:hypothetical protein
MSLGTPQRRNSRAPRPPALQLPGQAPNAILTYPSDCPEARVFQGQLAYYRSNQDTCRPIGFQGPDAFSPANLRPLAFQPPPLPPETPPAYIPHRKQKPTWIPRSFVLD